MKRIKNIFFTLIFAAAFTTAMAGSPDKPLHEPIQGEVVHQGNNRDCILIRFEADAKEVEKAWSKFLKKEYDVKLRGSSPMEAEATKFNAVSDKTMDLFTQISTDKEAAEMKVFARLGYDVYLNPEEFKDEFRAMEQVVEDFLASFLPDYYLEQIDAASEMLTSMKDERSDYLEDVQDNEADKADLVKEVSTIRDEISQKEDRIHDLKLLIEGKEMEMKKQQLKLDALRDKYREADKE